MCTYTHLTGTFVFYPASLLHLSIPSLFTPLTIPPLTPLTSPPVPPGPPTDFQVTGQTNVSLDFSWTNPVFSGFSPIASYRVQVNSSGNVSGFFRDLNVSAGATQGTLQMLDPLTEYTLRLFVTNEVGLEGDPDETTGMTLSNSRSLVCYGMVFPECLLHGDYSLFLSPSPFLPFSLPSVLPKALNLTAVTINSTAILVTWKVSFNNKAMHILHPRRYLNSNSLM